LGKLKKPDSFFSWIMSIANRVAKEQQRKHKRQQDAIKLLAQQRSEPQPPNDLPLEQAVHQLPQHYREVILLRYYGNRTCAQVAEQLEIPLGTVTVRLSRAYKMLRESLKRQDGQTEVRS